MNHAKPATTSQPPSKLSQLISISAAIIKAPPSRHAGQWADENRILPPESPEPGPWRTSRVPFWIPIYEAFENPLYSMIIGVMGAQMSKTEGVLNVLGKRFDDGPYMPSLYIGPTQKQVTSMSNDRFEKMLKSTPRLWDRLEKGHRNKTTEKFIGGIRFGFGWAGSATELSSHPAGLVMVDERDRMDNDVNGEGDPVMLAHARGKNFAGRKTGVFSTPTIQGASPIWSLFESGTMFKWAWPCPECDDYFVPELKFLIWPDKATPGEAKKAARVACPHCGALIESKHKTQMNENGKYIPHKFDEHENVIPCEEPIDTSVASFWVSGLASPWVSFGELAEVLVSAYRSKEDEQIQAAINTYGGELFAMSGDAPEWEDVLGLRAHYLPGSCPPDVQMITCGVDVQKNGIFYVVRGWGFLSESWLLEHGFIPGETEFDNVWLLLGRLREKKFGDRTINRMFIDSGYKPGDRFSRPDHQVYNFCRRHPGFAFPTKGHDTQEKPLKSAMIDVTMGGRIIKNGVQLWHINTDHFKTWLYSRIRWPEGESGAFHLHSEADIDYCQQIVSEELIVKASGRRTWKIKRGTNNHFLDCEVGAAAAAMTLQVHSLPEHPPETSRSNVHPNGEQNPESFIKRPAGSFIRR